jgi:hypothetical protein
MNAFPRPSIKRTAAVLALAAGAACSLPQTPAAGPPPAPPAAWTEAVADARYAVLFTEAGAGAHPMDVTGEHAPDCTATLHFRRPGETAVHRTVAYDLANAAPTLVLARGGEGAPVHALLIGRDARGTLGGVGFGDDADARRAAALLAEAAAACRTEDTR